MAAQEGLYHPRFESDACGIGFTAHLRGWKSHQQIADALTILENMEHRGACGHEENTGDGAGILIQIPHELFLDECSKMGCHLPALGKYGVGMVFFPKDLRLREACREILNRLAEKLGLDVLAWRKVPTDPSSLGSSALSVEPTMEQVFIVRPDHITQEEEFERKLFVLRNHVTHIIQQSVGEDPVGFYMASLSARIVVYKGQLTSLQVRNYFPDLRDKRCTSAFGLVHSRFATNTFPSWKLAQPFRFIAHNGEINTLQGNLNWLRTSEKGFVSDHFTREEMDMLLPLVTEGQSDSACLDNMIELLLHSGRSLPHVMMMLIPEAWDGNSDMDPVKKAFYEFHASIMEPWDGPASISFTDGKMIGATLDRNGLRPSRYLITTDDRVILASETGVLPVDPALVKEKGRLQPGKMFVVDMQAGCIISDEKLKASICAQQPYGSWLHKYKIRLEELPEPRVVFTHLEHEHIEKYQQAFGYAREDLYTLIAPMAIDGKEPIGSMGNDTPLAVMSEHPQHLANYFKQLFAQVTNPPIDPIRERMVMSLATFVGNNGNLLKEDPISCHTVALQHPILTNHELERLRSIDTGIYQAKTLQCYFRATGEAGALKRALDRICRYAVDAVQDGFEVLILQDRAIDSDHAPIPSLLAVSAVHHHLIKKGMRGQVGIVVEAGDAWEVHHFACLLGFGATAINPYLALSSIRDLKEHGLISTELSEEQLKKNYLKAINEGLLKVFSKMGISTLQSYQGAQIFEIVGIHSEVVDPYFTGAISRIGGLKLDDIARETLAKHAKAFPSNSLAQTSLPVGGVYQWKREGEFHLFNPQTIHLLQEATKQNDYSLFKKYSKLIDDQSERAATIRSFLTFTYNRNPIPLEEVEPASEIYRRFATGAMSFGSISWEAHTTLALAMNQLGGKSNTGEGGEDESRYETQAGQASMRSAIKQVASARFGVTSRYLTEADEIQIKMAQGAKPGEGGQLPGDKVDAWIGKTRHATPGVGLISPPPHHDIYSIEDLAQLIYDLKHANASARINVKLVSKAGVGTIAAGVVKAKADVVLIAGHDGGTGASPLSSIRHAGLPWELGLAETHQTLMRNQLRDRVVVQTDGQLKTGRDIAIAALLGAEEWGIATAALVVEGCIMMRKCHKNTCPVGIATQDPDLRKRFSGDPQHVIRFFQMITQELREIMASLGFRTVNEMIGQSQYLRVRDSITHWKHKTLDLTPILYQHANTAKQASHCTRPFHRSAAESLDQQMIEAAQDALQKGTVLSASFPIQNTDRAVGTLLSHEITKTYRSQQLPEECLQFNFVGTAGQSFGAFAVQGLSLTVEGDANDYVGKGLSGATLTLYPPKQSTYPAEQNSIVGNVAFYGATSGKAFIRGKAGERFAVRNSGAEVVVEGIGDHGCEYMTGGKVIILGEVGRNFAAGMSGGIAYVYDPNSTLALRYNPEMVDLDPLSEEDLPYLYAQIQAHTERTNSAMGTYILHDWEQQQTAFVKVFPKEYKKVLQAQLKSPLVHTITH
jgi:glutamate synthase (NADPH/NADH) large chain